MTDKLVRSSTNKVLSGVCGGLGRYFQVDPTLVRLAFVFATIFGVGTPVVIYAILAFVVPQEEGFDNF
ncbi:PspC domain-containing protein [Algivirga pacifica]